MVTKTRKMLAPKPGKEQLLIPRKSAVKNVGQALAGMKGGESRTGFLGGNTVRQPDYEVPVEYLSDKDRERRKTITELLMKVVEPAQLYARSTPDMDKRSFFNKLKKSSLEELKRLLPASVLEMPTAELNAESLSDEQKAEMQDLYKEISP